MYSSRPLNQYHGKQVILLPLVHVSCYHSTPYFLQPCPLFTSSKYFFCLIFSVVCFVFTIFLFLFIISFIFFYYSFYLFLFLLFFFYFYHFVFNFFPLNSVCISLKMHFESRGSRSVDDHNMRDSNLDLGIKLI